jgi:proteasome component ECM29
MRPAVDLEDESLIRRMFALFHGSVSGGVPDRQVQPAAAALRLRLMGLFSRSLAAASTFPENLKVCA